MPMDTDLRLPMEARSQRRVRRKRPTVEVSQSPLPATASCDRPQRRHRRRCGHSTRKEVFKRRCRHHGGLECGHRYYIRMRVQAILELTTLLTAAGTRALVAARAFLVQAKLLGWVAEFNTGSGVTPTAQLVLAQRERLRRELQLGAKPVAAPSTSQSARFKWLQRWRHKWQLPTGTIGTRDILSLEDVRAKAGLAMKASACKRASIRGCANRFSGRVGAGKRPQFGVRVWAALLSGGPENGTHFFKPGEHGFILPAPIRRRSRRGSSGRSVPRRSQAARRYCGVTWARQRASCAKIPDPTCFGGKSRGLRLQARPAFVQNLCEAEAVHEIAHCADPWQQCSAALSPAGPGCERADRV